MHAARAPVATGGPVWSRWRAAIGVVVCVAVPLVSWLLDGRGRFAYTMYSSTVTYRLEIAWLDEGGSRHPIDPSEVAGEVSSPAAPFLAGAGDLRTVAQIDALRAHLGDVARAACKSRHGPAIEITLHEHSLPLTSPLFSSEPEAIRTDRVTCPRAVESSK